MRLIDSRTGIEIIERDDCLHLLRSQVVGRVAASSAGRIIVLPVNYVMDGERIVFRTAAGAKLTAAVRSANVAFEIDHTDPVFRTGWSVMVSGRAEEETATDEIARFEDLHLRPWIPGEKDHWVVITPEVITGRRVVGLERSAP